MLLFYEPLQYPDNCARFACTRRALDQGKAARSLTCCQYCLLLRLIVLGQFVMSDGPGKRRLRLR